MSQRQREKPGRAGGEGVVGRWPIGGSHCLGSELRGAVCLRGGPPWPEGSPRCIGENEGGSPTVIQSRSPDLRDGFVESLVRRLFIVAIGWRKYRDRRRKLFAAHIRQLYMAPRPRWWLLVLAQPLYSQGSADFPASFPGPARLNPWHPRQCSDQAQASTGRPNEGRPGGTAPLSQIIES